MINFKQIFIGLRLKAKAVLNSDTKGELEVLESDGKLYYHDGTTRTALLTTTSASVITNKDLVDTTINIVDSVDPTKRINFDAAGTTGTRTTLLSSQTTNKTLTLPDATDTLVGKATTDILTNKTIDANGTGNSISNLETADLAAGVLNTSTTLATASNTQIPSALAVKTYVDDKAAAQDQAIEITYNNATSGLTATNVQAALDEIDLDLDVVQTILADHIADTVDAHDASAISSIPSGNLASTDVQSALNELQSDIDTGATGLAAHLSDATDAHDASAISVIAQGGITSTDVQAALEELQAEITAGGNGDVSGPASATDNAIARFDGATGKLIQNSVVTVSDTGVIAGSSIDGATNTLTNVTATTNANLTGPVTSVGNATAIGTGAITSTMILDGTILNADVNAAAAIARSKLASGIANAIVHNDASGVMTDQANLLTSANAVVLTNTAHLETQAATDAATTGANASLTAFTGGAIRLTNVSLVSLANIPAGANGQQLVLFNRTGVIVNIVDSSAASGTAANRILTGTSTTLALAIDASISLQYDSTTTRWQIIGGSGSGSSSSGGINYITNFNAETDTVGWATYADAAGVAPVDGTGGAPTVTLTRTTASPLRGAASFLFTKDAANRQGEGASYAFTIDAADQGKVLQGSFDYSIASGTFADNDMSVWIYDVTNGVLIQPAPYLLKNSTITERFGFEFQTAINSTSYRLILHVASTSALAYTVKLDNITVGPGAKLYGSPMTDWVTYTPTYVGFGTVSASSAKWRRDGDTLEVSALVTTGTVTAVIASMTLPPGLSIDSAKIIAQNTTANPGQMVGRYVQTIGTLNGSVVSAVATSTSLLYFGFSEGGAGSISLTPQNGSGTMNSSQPISITFIVPILGWSSSQVMSNDASTRVVAISYNKSGTQAVTANVTDITFVTKVIDTHAAFNGTSFTAPVSGTYSISGVVVSSTAGNVGYMIAIDGSQVGLLGVSSTSTDGATLAGLIELRAGQVFTLRADTSVTVSASSKLQIHRIAGPSQIMASESINARYFASATVVTGSLATVNYTTKDFDSHSGYSAGTYTVASAGKYQVNAALALTGTFVLNSTAILEIQKNGTVVARYTSFSGGAVTQMKVDVDALLNCIAGDTIRAQVSSSGTTPAIVSSNFDNYISLFRAGN